MAVALATAALPASTVTGAAAPAVQAEPTPQAQGGAPGAQDTFTPAATGADAATALQGAPAAQPQPAAGDLTEKLGKLVADIGQVLQDLGTLLQGGGGGTQTPEDPGGKTMPPPPPNQGGGNEVKNAMEKDLPAHLAQIPDKVKALNANVQMKISGPGGGTWTIDGTKDSNWVSTGAQGTPKMTVNMSSDTFLKLKNKQLDPMTAVMNGQIKFEPFDMDLAQKFGDLMK